WGAGGAGGAGAGTAAGAVAGGGSPALAGGAAGLSRGAAVIDLPRALAPWRAYLELFPRELALALWPLVQRLDVAIGPLRVHTLAGAGDPDGFDGITRRGSYEHLLLS